MGHSDDTTRILLSQEAARHLATSINRRRFLALSGGAAALAALSACGSSAPAKTAPKEFDKNLSLLSWADYHDPALLKAWGNISLTIISSNEEALQELTKGGASSDYDIVVLTGLYIPQAAKAGMLLELDKSRLPNISNIDPVNINQPWDLGNKYSVCKDWGTTGWIYDKQAISTEINTWADFIKVAQTEASGKTYVMDAPNWLSGIYFWANGIDWTTEKTEDLDAYAAFMKDFVPHVHGFNSYGSADVVDGTVALAQVWNGMARLALQGVVDAGGDPSRYAWGIGAPVTDIWMDNWCILKGAKNIDAAYDFINFILDPVNSVNDLKYHGFNTGIKGVKELAQDIPLKEMVFFTDAELATMKSGAVNSSFDRLGQIYNDAKVSSSQ